MDPPGIMVNKYSLRGSRKLHKVPGQTRKRNITHHNKKKNLTSKLQCPKGKIPRHGYIRKFGNTVMRKGYTVKRVSGQKYHINPKHQAVYVKPVCVKDPFFKNIKQPGSGKRSDIFERGQLKKHGYVYTKTTEDRHESLVKAVKDFGARNVYRKLKLLVKLSRYSVPQAAGIFREDRDWVKRKYELL